MLSPATLSPADKIWPPTPGKKKKNPQGPPPYPHPPKSAEKTSAPFPRTLDAQGNSFHPGDWEAPAEARPSASQDIAPETEKEHSLKPHVPLHASGALGWWPQ